MTRYLVEVHYTDPVNFFSRPPDGFVVRETSDVFAVQTAIMIARTAHRGFQVTGGRILSRNGHMLEPGTRASRFRPAPATR